MNFKRRSHSIVNTPAGARIRFEHVRHVHVRGSQKALNPVRHVLYKSNKNQNVITISHLYGPAGAVGEMKTIALDMKSVLDEDGHRRASKVSRHFCSTSPLRYDTKIYQ
eukprot:jgi/Botrbrau1/7375/Bobra.0316s0019.1